MRREAEVPKDEGSLIATIAKSGAAEAAAELSEVAVDQFLTAEVIKDIPFVGVLAKLYNAGITVRDSLFIRKLSRFLADLAAIPEAERSEFGRRMDADPKFRERVGENLISAIERLDDSEKTRLLANAFAAFVRDEIIYETLQYLTHVIDRCLAGDLQNLSTFKKGNRPISESAPMLAAVGLLELRSIPAIRGPGAENRYELTQAGELFISTVLANSDRAA